MDLLERVPTPTDPILYVEDDDDHVFFLRRAFKLASSPHPLFVTPSAEQAIAYLSGQGPFENRDVFPMPSLVLTDLKLPGVSGLQLVCWIRRNPRLAGLRTVVVSSSSHVADIAAARAFGANGYIIKPMNRAKAAALLTSHEAPWPEEPATSGWLGFHAARHELHSGD